MEPVSLSLCIRTDCQGPSMIPPAFWAVNLKALLSLSKDAPALQAQVTTERTLGEHVCEGWTLNSCPVNPADMDPAAMRGARCRART